MAATVFVTLERDITGIEGFEMNGKPIAKVFDELDDLTEQLDVLPLCYFLSHSTAEVEEMREVLDLPPAELKRQLELLQKQPVKPGSDVDHELLSTLIESLQQPGKKPTKSKKQLAAEMSKELKDEITEEDLEEMEDSILSENWFEPVEGLETVQALIGYLAKHPKAIKNSKEVLEDLKGIEHILQHADSQEVMFHLSMAD